MLLGSEWRLGGVLSRTVLLLLVAAVLVPEAAADGSIGLFHSNHGGFVGSIATGLGTPRWACIDPLDTEAQQRWVYVSELDGRVSKHNMYTGEDGGVVVDHLLAPKGIALHPETLELYVVEQGNGAITAFDRLTGTQRRAVVEPESDTSGLLTKPDSLLFWRRSRQETYLLVSTSDAVLMLNATSGDVVSRVQQGLVQPAGMAISDSGRMLFIADTAASSVLKVSLEEMRSRGPAAQPPLTPEVLVQPHTGYINAPQGLAIGPEGQVFVASSGNNLILEYGPRTGSFLRVFAVDTAGMARPSDLLFDHFGNLLVVSAKDDPGARTGFVLELALPMVVIIYMCHASPRFRSSVIVHKAAIRLNRSAILCALMAAASLPGLTAQLIWFSLAITAAFLWSLACSALSDTGARAQAYEALIANATVPALLYALALIRTIADSSACKRTLQQDPGSCLPVFVYPALFTYVYILVPLMLVVIIATGYFVNDLYNKRAQYETLELEDDDLEAGYPIAGSLEVNPDLTSEKLTTQQLLDRVNPDEMATVAKQPFGDRVEWLTEKLRRVFMRRGLFKLSVSRQSLTAQAIDLVGHADPADLRMQTRVEFEHEEGQDLGGLSREFFQTLVAEMLRPQYGLFRTAGDGSHMLVLNPEARLCHDDHEKYYRVLGRFMALALMQRHHVPAWFAPSVWKQLLRRPLVLKDLQHVDPEFHRSLSWILDNDVDTLELDWTLDHEAFGEMLATSLLPEGEDCDRLVTNDDKEEYVNRATAWRLGRDTGPQVDALRYGFEELLPMALLEMFSEQELEQLICGAQEIDLGDWFDNTLYEGWDGDEEVLMWFWEELDQMSDRDLTLLLQFVTGTSRVPYGGFAALRGNNGEHPFVVRKVEEADRLVAASTCFNRLYLPMYPSRQVLHDRILLAIRETAGFSQA